MLTASGFYATLGVGKGSGEGGTDISLTASSLKEYAAVAVQVASLPKEIQAGLRAEIQEKVGTILFDERPVREWERFLRRAYAIQADAGTVVFGGAQEAAAAGGLSDTE
jgi:hypothetical protein